MDAQKLAMEAVALHQPSMDVASKISPLAAAEGIVKGSIEMVEMIRSSDLETAREKSRTLTETANEAVRSPVPAQDDPTVEERRDKVAHALGEAVGAAATIAAAEALTIIVARSAPVPCENIHIFRFYGHRAGMAVARLYIAAKIAMEADVANPDAVAAAAATASFKPP